MTRHLITSALPYINGIKHLGNLVGSQLPADLFARYLRARGHEVLFLCATDEHGTPAELAAAKAGLAGMTGALAPELAPFGITVNCVVPAMINTDRGGGEIPPYYATRPIPMGRTGEPEEVAAFVRFLSGPGARFISGQSLHVNGGWHVTI